MAAKRKNSSRLASGQSFSSSRGVLVSVAVAVFGFLMIFNLLASSPLPSLTLDPSAVTVKQGDTFTVDLVLKAAGLAVTSVDINLLYPQAKLQLVSSNPPLNQIVNITPPSPVSLPGKPSSPVKQNSQIIGTVTFRALSDT